MSCVEGAVAAQVPGPNQYWEHIKSKDRAYFIGRDPDGRMVWQCEGDGIEVGNLDWSGWRHIPGCTGWDWEPDQAEEYPQYYVGTQWADGTAYVVRWGETHAKGVGKSGAVFVYAWDDIAKRFVERGTLVRVTEAEAMARLDKPAAEETYPQYWTSPAVGSTAAFVKRVSQTECVTVMPSGTYGPSLSWEHSFPESRTRLTEQEALALLDKPVPVPAETWPQYYINRDPGLKWYIRAENHRKIPNVYLPDGSIVTSQANWDDIESSLSRGIWIEVTEAEARARIAVPAEPEKAAVSFVPVAPEMDWVVQDRVPARNNVDEWCWCKRGRSPGHFYSGFGGWSGTIMHGHVDGDEVLHLRCRRKDLPVVESPDDWVVQDRVEARPGIDQGWWAYDEQAVDHGAFKWWKVSSTDMVCTKKHGYCSYDGLRLYLRCRRKDLPPVPAPAEETFPQWYILKDDEKRSWVPDWTVKRTGEETAIRYARDEAGELYATNEPWTGAPDCWERCSDAEAIVRMGTLMFPRVPSEPRRVPVKLWVTYRLNDEGGDWPVRATQADQTCQNWKEIKFDGNGAFIEV